MRYKRWDLSKLDGIVDGKTRNKELRKSAPGEPILYSSFTTNSTTAESNGFCILEHFHVQYLWVSKRFVSITAQICGSKNACLMGKPPMPFPIVSTGDGRANAGARTLGEHALSCSCSGLIRMPRSNVLIGTDPAVWETNVTDDRFRDLFATLDQRSGIKPKYMCTT